MGTCKSVSQIDINRDSFNQKKLLRCIISRNPQQISIEGNDGKIITFPIKIMTNQLSKICKINLSHTSTSFETTSSSILKASHQSQKIGGVPQLYFSTDNRVYYIQNFREINQSDPKFIETAYAYYLLRKLSLDKSTILENKKNLSVTNLCVTVSDAYLIMESNQQGKKHNLTFIMESNVLQSEKDKVKFVDLVDLGCRMKEKQIFWQDAEFSQIIVESCRSVVQLQKLGISGVTNIIIGSDGSVRAIGKFHENSTNKVKNQPLLKDILFTALYGVKALKNLEDINNCQQKCKFKHPNTLEYLKNYPKILMEEENNLPNIIKSPHLKFIQGYIEAYFYKMQMFCEETLDALLKLGKYQEGKKMCSDYINFNNLANQESKQSHKMYQILVQATQKIRKSSTFSQNFSQAIQYCGELEKLEEISFKMGRKQFQNNRFSQAFKYFLEARQSCLKNSNKNHHKNQSNTQFQKLELQLYLKLYQTMYTLGEYSLTQQILLQGISRKIGEKILGLIYIFYLCDCTRVQEAEKRLYQYTKVFSTFELEVCSAKILMTKALCQPNSRSIYLQKAQQDLNIAAETCLQVIEGEQRNLAKSYFYQIRGDIKMSIKRYEQATESYHNGQMFMKRHSNHLSCPRLITLMAAQANSLLLLKQFGKAQKLYLDCLELTSDECKSLMNMIKGNIGILKMKRGDKNQGRLQIQKVLKNAAEIDKKQNCNYIFLDKMANNQIKRQSSTQSQYSKNI